MKKLVSIFAGACMLLSCNNEVANKQAEQLQAQQRSLDSVKNALAQQHTIDSMNAVIAAQQQEAAQQQASAPASGHHTRVIEREHTTVTNNNTTQLGQANAAEAPHKKGWSAKAKGAVIGAGVGALTGAMVDKKKGEGAVVGGIIGAGSGLGVGAIIDKKKKDKEKEDANK